MVDQQTRDGLAVAIKFSRREIRDVKTGGGQCDVGAHLELVGRVVGEAEHVLEVLLVADHVIAGNVGRTEVRGDIQALGFLDGTGVPIR